MLRIVMLAALCLGFATFRVSAEEAAPKLEPGKAVVIEFPEMPATLYESIHHEGTKPAMTIALPKNYDPQRKHPLLVFLQGGDGSAARQANVGRAVTEERDFVCVSLPFFRQKMDKPDIKLLDDDFKFMWPLYKTMLARLDQLVPNIDPARRVIGGFSNGGHTTAGMIDDVGDEFVHYFSAYLLVEGGFKLQHFDRIKNKPLLVLYGGARNRDWDTLFGKPAQEAGVRVTMHKMENTGHAFPNEQYPVVREWLRDLVK